MVILSKAHDSSEGNDEKQSEYEEFELKEDPLSARLKQSKLLKQKS